MKNCVVISVICCPRLSSSVQRSCRAKSWSRVMLYEVPEACHPHQQSTERIPWPEVDTHRLYAATAIRRHERYVSKFHTRAHHVGPTAWIGERPSNIGRVRQTSTSSSCVFKCQKNGQFKNASCTLRQLFPSLRTFETFWHTVSGQHPKPESYRSQTTCHAKSRLKSRRNSITRLAVSKLWHL